MSQQTPTQDLVAKDLHGYEWRFKHIFRGNDVLDSCVVKLTFLSYYSFVVDPIACYQVNPGDTCLQLDGVHLSPQRDL